MSKTLAPIAKTFKRFREDNRGMEAVQAVLLVALAAIMMLGVLSYFNGDIKDKVRSQVNNVLDNSSDFNAAN